MEDKKLAMLENRETARGDACAQKELTFQRELLQLAVPVTLQCLMQPSFSVADQIMTGQLGSVSIAGIGLGGKFASLYSVVIAAVASVAVTSICSAYLRCVGAAKAPLYAGIFASVANTVLNYVLIFGKAGFPAMGVRGAAIASVAAQALGCALTAAFFLCLRRKNAWKLPFALKLDRLQWKQYMAVFLPLLVCEFFWSLGENVYASIYGHVGTKALAAMTLTNPLQALVMEALSGVSQAAGVMIGKRLGAGDEGSAYRDAKKLMRTGLGCSVLLSAAVLALHKYYVLIFPVEDAVRRMTMYVLTVYAFVAPVKVQNMILGGLFRAVNGGVRALDAFARCFQKREVDAEAVERASAKNAGYDLRLSCFLLEIQFPQNCIHVPPAIDNPKNKNHLLFASAGIPI